MNTATELAWIADARTRRIRRFVESSSFQFIYKNAENKQLADGLIVAQDLDGLRLWLYNQSSFYDSPTRWLKEQAKKHRIPNYSRMTKVELVKELTGKPDFNAGDDDSTAPRSRR